VGIGAVTEPAPLIPVNVPVILEPQEKVNLQQISNNKIVFNCDEI
jgi:hypothetical protein